MRCPSSQISDHANRQSPEIEDDALHLLAHHRADEHAVFPFRKLVAV
jgi:hypothetical protein